MSRDTVDGRPVYLRRTRSGWVVRWGRTAISCCRTWQEAVADIMALYGKETS